MVVSWTCLKNNARPCHLWVVASDRKNLTTCWKFLLPQLVGTSSNNIPLVTGNTLYSHGWQSCPQPNSDLFQGVVRTRLNRSSWKTCWTRVTRHNQKITKKRECLTTKLLTWSIFKSEKVWSPQPPTPQPPDIKSNSQGLPLRFHARGWYDATIRLCSRASHSGMAHPEKPGKTWSFFIQLWNAIIDFQIMVNLPLYSNERMSSHCSSLGLVVWDATILKQQEAEALFHDQWVVVIHGYF